MTRKTLIRVLVAAAIATVLGGASLIIAGSGPGTAADAPAGWVH